VEILAEESFVDGPVESPVVEVVETVGIVMVELALGVAEIEIALGVAEIVGKLDFDLGNLEIVQLVVALEEVVQVCWE